MLHMMKKPCNLLQSWWLVLNTRLHTRIKYVAGGILPTSVVGRGHPHLSNSISRNGKVYELHSFQILGMGIQSSLPFLEWLGSPPFHSFNSEDKGIF